MDGCEILHHLMVYPIIYRVLTIRLVVQDFFHPQTSLGTALWYPKRCLVPRLRVADAEGLIEMLQFYQHLGKDVLEVKKNKAWTKFRIDYKLGARIAQN